MAVKYDWGDGRGRVHSRPKNPTGVPLRPPPGSYDPSIDVAERANQRGLEDLIGTPPLSAAGTPVT